MQKNSKRLQQTLRASQESTPRRYVSERMDIDLFQVSHENDVYHWQDGLVVMTIARQVRPSERTLIYPKYDEWYALVNKAGLDASLFNLPQCLDAAYLIFLIPNAGDVRFHISGQEVEDPHPYPRAANMLPSGAPPYVVGITYSHIKLYTFCETDISWDMQGSLMEELRAKFKVSKLATLLSNLANDNWNGFDDSMTPEQIAVMQMWLYDAIYSPLAISEIVINLIKAFHLELLRMIDIISGVRTAGDTNPRLKTMEQLFADALRSTKIPTE